MELSITKAKTLHILNSLESKTSNIGTNSNNNEKKFKAWCYLKINMKHST